MVFIAMLGDLTKWYFFVNKLFACKQFDFNAVLALKPSYLRYGTLRVAE